MEYMDEPLTRWYCDTCGGVIELVTKGCVVWKCQDLTEQRRLRFHSFRIIHPTNIQLVTSGQTIINLPNCDPGKDFIRHAPLTDFVGINGLSNLLANLSLGPFLQRQDEELVTMVEMDEYVDFFRRVQMPYYEEARRYFGNENLIERMLGENELFPYRFDKLREIIQEFGQRTN